MFEYYHVPSMKKLFVIQEKENSLHCCDFSKTGEHFATAGKDAHIRIYDESNRISIKTPRALQLTWVAPNGITEDIPTESSLSNLSTIIR
jgi:WD40 repeat protein